jgi:nitrite reductase/ring-hydroxylating ferredoxin subunit
VAAALSENHPMGTTMSRHRNGSQASEYVDVGRFACGRWRVRVNGRDLVVSVSPFRVWAFEATCPHRGLPLDDGVIRGRTVTCPFHGRTFDLRDGHPLPSRGDKAASGCPLTVFPVVRKRCRLLLRLPGS